MRDVVRGETIRLDLVEGRAEPTTHEPGFQGASVDGSRAFFIDREPLIHGAGKLGFDLYACDIVETAGKLACRLVDLTPEAGGEPAEVQSVVGENEDGAYVYFVAKGVLSATANSAGEAAVSGANNLYVRHYSSEHGSEGWEPARFVAGLSREEEIHQVAGVSPDGRFVAFRSVRSLTGYDNTDVVTGAADEEVYVYDTSTGRLGCVSCNPTGARPLGASAYPAGHLPDSGRLFFDSRDALVPQDANGVGDVYEYEPVGVAGCTGASAGFSVGAGGCVGLISSGTSSEESRFLDASESGGDAFFMTTESLVPQDVDTSADVYDAHECTAGSPCVVPPVSPPACSTSDACKGAPGQQPSVFGSPASATLSGAGNLAQPPTPGAVGKSKPKAKAGCRAKARRLKQPARRRRALQRCAKGAVRARRSARGVGPVAGKSVSRRAGR
jgi:hypothetical protein